MTSISAETKIAQSPCSAPQTRLADLWCVVVLNDGNTKRYVTAVLRKVFGFSDSLASQYMWEAHTTGRAQVWIGQREQAEAYIFALHKWHLSAVIERDAPN